MSQRYSQTMNNKLTPAVIVDKNGRTTTVHRKADRTVTHSAIPAPTVKAPTISAGKKTPQKHSTPLPVPPPIDPKTLRERVGHLRGIQALSVRKNPNPDEVALINSILDRGHVSPNAIGMVSDYMGMMSTGERIRDFDYNTFLLTERYASSSGAIEVINYTDAHHFVDAIKGLYQRRSEQDITVERITTEEELDANVAVLRMMMLIRENSDQLGRATTTKEYRTANGKRLNGTCLRNQGFAELIRENHEFYPAIEQYVMDRGVPKNKHEVNALKTYLNNSHEHTTAIAEGWL